MVGGSGNGESFRFSTDPEAVVTVTDVVGLYLAPAQDAIAPCVDEKSEIQAPDCTAPVLPTQPHLIERPSSDHVRNGTTTSFASLELATGKVTAALIPRTIHRGTYRSVRDLNAKIRPLIDGSNDCFHPSVWTKNADDILKSASRQTTSGARH